MCDNKKMLAQEWANIEKRVAKPLWYSKYKQTYEALKLDYDDFVSLAAFELNKAIVSFDASKSNIFTFANNVIKRKVMTELRNYTQRDIRKTLHMSDSVDALDKSIVENIPSKETISPNTELSERRVGNFVNSLNNNQLRVLVLNLLEFDMKDVPEMLNISNKTAMQIIKSLKDTDLTRVLFREEF